MRLCTQELAPVAWMETVNALAHQASHAERVSVEGAMGIALLAEGEVVGVIDVSTQNLADGSTKIVALRAITGAVRLQAANRLLGRAAVKKLLARIQQDTIASITMRCDFPVDVHA
jgi:hypothetical protein